MPYYDRINISEGIDTTKSNQGRECMICYHFFELMDSNFKIMCAMGVMIDNIKY